MRTCVPVTTNSCRENVSWKPRESSLLVNAALPPRKPPRPPNKPVCLARKSNVSSASRNCGFTDSTSRGPAASQTASICFWFSAEGWMNAEASSRGLSASATIKASPSTPDASMRCSDTRGVAPAADRASPTFRSRSRVSGAQAPYSCRMPPVHVSSGGVSTPSLVSSVRTCWRVTPSSTALITALRISKSWASALSGHFGGCSAGAASAATGAARTVPAARGRCVFVRRPEARASTDASVSIVAKK
mmetsp:Transcript_8006/g.23890  ORF Transcript_8006/g.23890 Transcript_8006/m.23890 type:complete len:247 (+) Transcript_8006:249-989(+)